MKRQHEPVLLNEVLQGCNIQPSGVYVDCTFGYGGHSRAILQHLGKQGRLLAFDRDPATADCLGDELQQDVRFTFINSSYTMLNEQIIQRELVGQVHGILFDLGVSSPQLDDPSRGFSFQKDGVLDMRMDNRCGKTAAEWLQYASEKDIARVLREYGEERFATRIARRIVKSRLKSPILSTLQLANLVASAMPFREKGKHPATRTFQAIRIFINRELDELALALSQVIELLACGGRLLVISFHSLEDRLVKRFMRQKSRGDDVPRHIPLADNQRQPKLCIVAKPVRPRDEEVAANPRARSAILRIAERVIV